MSRYLSFVLLALSATSVLAAPAELPTVPDLSTITDPSLGPRSNGKVYSPNSLHKRDWEYPSSTKDCRMSEISEDETAHSYTHDGVEYSEECLTQLALSVPFEDRKSCRTTGPNAIGYDEQCLFKKAFDEDWKFDMEKAKEDELAWRAANPSHPSSDHWRTHYPSKAADCLWIELDLKLKIDADKEKEEKEEEWEKEEEEKEEEKDTIWRRDDEGKEVKGKKKDAFKTSDDLNGWKPYSVAPDGKKFDNECMVRFVLKLKLVIDLGKCPAHHDDKPKTESLGGGGSPVEKLLPKLHDRSSTDLATRAESKSLDIGVSAIVALRLGCIVSIVVKVALKVGLHTKVLNVPLAPVLALVKVILSLLHKH